MRRVVVSIGDDRPFSEVVRDLQARGFRLEQPMEAIGVAAGSAADDTVAKLAQVPGVLSVEDEGGVQLAPPDSKIQ